MIEDKEGLSLSDFYDNFEERTPLFILILMTLTFGLYFIYWIYVQSKRFEMYAEDTPEPFRGVVIMIIMPLCWFIFIYGIRFFTGFDIYLKILEMIGWIGISFLALQYLYEFCETLGRFTSSNGLIWYMFIWVGFVPIVLLPLQSYFLISAMIFPVFAIVTLQIELNKKHERFIRDRTTKIFYKQIKVK